MLTWLNQKSGRIFALGAVSFLIGLIQSFTIVPPNYLIIFGLVLMGLGGMQFYRSLRVDPGNHPFKPIPLPAPVLPSPPAPPSPNPHTPPVEIDVLRTSWDSEAEPAWKMIKCLAEISNDSYLPPVQCIPVWKKRGFETVDVCLIDSMVCYVLRAKKLTIIVFRGTDDPYDWIANANDRRFSLNEGFMHRGFWDAYQRLKSQITEVLLNDEPEFFWATGHSLGGALAGACAFDREMLDKKLLTGVVTLGQPRFADPFLCELIDRDLQGKFLRLINNQDPVPRIPPSFDFCGVALWFKPTGVERSIPVRQLFGAGPAKVQQMIEVPGPKAMSEAEYQQFKNEIRRNKEIEEAEFDDQGRPLMKAQFLREVDDHDMANYLLKIEEQIRKP